MQAAPQEHHLEEEEEEAPQEHHLEEEEEEAPQEQYLEEEKEEEEEPQLLRPCKKQQRWPCPVAMLLLSLQALTHKTQRWWLCNRIVVVALLMVSAWQNLGVLVVCMQLMIIAIDDFPVQV